MHSVPPLLNPLIFFCFAATTLDRAGRLTGRRIISTKYCLWEDISVWTELSTSDREKGVGGKKNPNNNLCKKIFDGCSFSFHMDQNSAPLLNSNYRRARWRGNTQMIPLKLTFSEKVTPKRWEKNNSATKIWRRKEKKKKKWLRLPVKR